ncbi:hypothetical protein [Roseivivax sp. THAF197b]|uniref:hypothetical protein n=1 Tax=Roseivivax sp. THAF197b TaxID=2588299 RepID=UPI0012680C68|nr:hypothetical protein [Roseivivax sp. THAF197b]
MSETKVNEAARRWGQAATHAQNPRILREGGGGPYDGGGGDGTMERIARLEVKFEGIDDRLRSIDSRLDRIENKIPSKWDMAQVVFFVVGALMAAAIFGPRLAAMLPTSS